MAKVIIDRTNGYLHVERDGVVEEETHEGQFIVSHNQGETIFFKTESGRTVAVGNNPDIEVV